MPAFIGRRILEGAFSLWIVLSLVFLLMQIIPGDPSEAILSQSTASQSVLSQRRAELGLDAPISQQYFRSLAGLVSSDQSVVSWATGESVRSAVARQFGPTAWLALSSMVVAVVTGLLLGIGGSLGKGLLAEVSRSAAGFLVAVPVMFSGTLLIWLFSVLLAWLPATGESGLRSLLMPAVAVGLSTAGAVARAVDATVSDVMNLPFVLAARARGLRRRRIIWRHVLPVALVPILDVLSVQFGYLLAGTIVAETVFARQGLGRLMLVAVLNKDLPMVQGVVTINAFFYLVFNFAVDLLRGLLDPRIRFG